MTKPFRHGLVLGKFYPLHASHSNLIRTALRQCDEVTVQLLVNSAETIPLATRLPGCRRSTRRRTSSRGSTTRRSTSTRRPPGTTTRR